MFVDIPLVHMSVKILKFWAFIYENNWRRYVSLTATTCLILTQFVYIWRARSGPLTDFVRNMYMLFLWVNTVVRAILLVYERKGVETILNNLACTFKKLQQSKDTFIVNLVEQTNLSGKSMARGNLFLGGITCIGFTFAPLFSSDRVLPFGSTIPGIDEYQSPYYELLYLFQVVVTPIGCCMFIPYTSLIVAFVMFGIFMCKLLQYRLRNISRVEKCKQYAEAVACIDVQNYILEFITSVNNFTAFIFLYEFLGFGMLLCALLFLLIIVKTLAEMVTVCAYITMIFAQIFMLYWYANEFREQFSHVALAAYETDWYNYSVKVQKLFTLIILRSQRTTTIMVGNIHPMTLALFQALLNASYKFFTVLNHLYG